MVHKVVMMVHKVVMMVHKVVHKVVMMVHKVVMMVHKVILIWYCIPSAYKAVLQEAVLKQHLKHARIEKVNGVNMENYGQ